MQESSTYQAILAQGREQGRQQGLQEGREEGRVIEARQLLRKVGDRRFGPPDARTATTIDGIDELARLEELFDQLDGAASWEELLGPPARGRRGRRR